MRRTAAVVEIQAARSSRAVRRRPRSENAGSPLPPLKHDQVQELLHRSRVLLSSSIPSAWWPRSALCDAILGSHLFVHAVGSSSVPSVVRSTGGERGRQRGTSEEQGVWRRERGSLKSHTECRARKVRPNPSVKRSATGMALGPRSAMVHHAPVSYTHLTLPTKRIV